MPKLAARAVLGGEQGLQAQGAAQGSPGQLLRAGAAICLKGKDLLHISFST